MTLHERRVAMIVADEFEDIELWYPMIRLSEEGAWITIATVQDGFHPRPFVPGKPISGRFGTTVPPMVHEEGRRFDIKSVEDLSANEYDAVVIPGGFSPDILRLHAPTLDFIRAMEGGGKVLAAICHGTWVFISAGLVAGRRVTGYAAVKDDLTNAGAHYVDEAAVTDGTIVTARVPDDLPEFCRAIIDVMAR